MDTWVRTLSVAILALVAGFIMSRLAVEDPAEAPAPAYTELVTEISSTSYVPAPPPVVLPEPLPVPAVLPSVSYRYEPVPVVAMLPVAPEPTVMTELERIADTEIVAEVPLEEWPPEREYVATLHEADLGIEDGFAGLEPGTLTRMTWRAGESLYGSAIPTPVLVAEGVEPGRTLCLTGAVHGDELNGIEIVRRVMYSLDPEKLTGRVVGVPIVNLQGFERHSRYPPDRRDLNRFFPGNPRGSSASRIAHSFFQQVVRHCGPSPGQVNGAHGSPGLPGLR